MNAKEEFIKAIGALKVKCAIVRTRVREESLLKVGYSPEEFYKFLDSLDFNYDASFGHQCVFGTIWHEDGTWQERYEYNGSERWVHVELPEIPKNLLKY